MLCLPVVVRNLARYNYLILVRLTCIYHDKINSQNLPRIISTNMANSLYLINISVFTQLREKRTIAVIYVTKSRTGNYDFRACARARGFPGSTLFGRTHMLRRVCRAITR